MDPTKETGFGSLEQWDRGDKAVTIFKRGVDPEDEGVITGHSLSGSERNRIFFRTKDNFDDATLASGIDFRADGRGFALFDYDNDGMTDIGVISNQHPRFRIARNRVADSIDVGGYARIRLVGGNESATPSSEFSARDAIGAVVRAKIGRQVRAFPVSCGEGLSSQNSSVVQIGLGSADSIDQVAVHWPSGRISKLGPLAEGSLTTVLEKDQSEPGE